MIFVRVTISHTTGRVLAVFSQDTPYTQGGEALIEGEDCETLDLGVVDDGPWTDANGDPCALGEYVLARLQKKSKAAEPQKLKAATADEFAELAELPRVMDSPCTVRGIKQRLRERGPAGLPVTVRAWLANVLPPDEVQAMGIARGIPLSAIKSAERLRNKRDPSGGSRLFALERKTQQRADALASTRLRHRKHREEKREARALKRAAKKLARGRDK